METNKIAFWIGSPFLLSWGIFFAYVLLSETSTFVTKIILLGLTISLLGMIYYLYKER